MGAKYDRIGIGYNVTRKADPHIAEQLLKHLRPTPEGIYLDIGCGTGNYTNEFQKRGFQFIGIDPSMEMLEKAQQKNKNIDWRIGVAESMALLDKTVDGIVGSLTLHHWTDLEKGFSELYRVLKPNGRIVFFTATPEQMKGYWLNHYFPNMMSDAIVQMPSLESVKNAMLKSHFQILGIDNYFVQSDLQDKFLYCGKHHPEVYFNQHIRNGISSFSSLANRTEVEEGLSQLKTDIDNGTINSVIDAYANDLGDYLYIIGKKPGADKGYN